MRFEDKVFLVTGASRGIGYATAKQAASEGARVVGTYLRNAKEAQSLQKEIGENGLVLPADITKEEDVKVLVKTVMKKYGHIDVLINNAGQIFRPGDWKSDLATWQKTIDTNLTGHWMMIREVAPLMLKQKSGSIVNVASVYGFLGAAPVLAYTSAKGGLITLTKSFAKELAPLVRVNAVAPSNVMTDMTRAAGAELIAQFTKDTPLGHIAEPLEIAKAILFLASDDASYITGEMLVVDGGYSLK